MDENGYRFGYEHGNAEYEHIALASHKNTEVLRISPVTINPVLNLDMFGRQSFSNAGIRAAFYSAAFLLQRVIADQLDVDPVEIEIADIVRVETNGGDPTAEIILTDELPNGSGFVRKLFEDISTIIESSITLGTDNRYLSSIQSEEHREECKDACYDCLKVFRNMNYHGLLDWRLAISLLRSLVDTEYQAGADGGFSDYYELESWPKEARKLRDTFAESFNFEVKEEYNLPVLKARTGMVVIVVHPLWKCHISDSGLPNLPADTWLSEEVFKVYQDASADNASVRFIDSFNLQRRPGWCYQQLLNS